MFDPASVRPRGKTKPSSSNDQSIPEFMLLGGEDRIQKIAANTKRTAVVPTHRAQSLRKARAFTTHPDMILPVGSSYGYLASFIEPNCG